MMRLEDQEIRDRLDELQGWREEDNVIAQCFTFADFRTALGFVMRVGECAEQADHHPDIRMHDWNKVTVSLTTHSEGGLTEKDFQLAAEITRLAP